MQIEAIMSAAHAEMHSLHEQMHANSLTLRNTKPSDPNYASIVSQVSQTHGSLSAQAQKHGNRGGHGPDSGEPQGP